MKNQQVTSNYLEATLARFKTWDFWRAMIACFFVFSVIGHLLEWVYCFIGVTFFNSMDPTAEVLTNPFKPFFVYGIGIVICAVVLDPIKWMMLRKFSSRRTAFIVFYIMSVFLGMIGELTQGFLQNQPVDGVYPLWDVSIYPGNILGQAWIVNDIFIGAIITFAVWGLYPLISRRIGKLAEPWATINMLLIVAAVGTLTLFTYGFI